MPRIARDGNVLNIGRLEAVDGSPIIDVKPYSKSCLLMDNLKMTEWMELIHRELEADLFQWETTRKKIMDRTEFEKCPQLGGP